MLVEKKFKIRPQVIIFCVLILVLFFGVVFGGYSWFLKRQERVLAGFARPVFPYSDYSIAELGKLYPQYVNEDVTTTRTPEETHRMFVEKLKEGDFDGAVECCVVAGNRKQILDLLNSVQKRGQMELMLKDISEIKEESLLYTMATYSYVSVYKGEKYANGIEFIKNNQGVWLIKSF